MKKQFYLKAGDYWIGDLCYILDNHWDEVCELTIKDNKCLSGVFELSNGQKFAIFNTYCGDGCYLDNDDNEYNVDSGTIGCIMISPNMKQKKNYDFGHTFKFHNEFRVYERSGIIHFGYVSIDTKD